MFTYVTTLEAAVELRPALLSTSKAWELDSSSSSWRTPGTLSPDDVHSQNWPAHESASFRVLSSRAAAEAHDVRELEAKLRNETQSTGDAAVGGAARARLLYRLGRAHELLGMSRAAGETFDKLIELRGNGALDEHVHHAYMVSGRTRAAQGRLEQGILRFLAAYELLPERGVEPLVDAAVACRQSGKTPNLARLFAFAAVAENQALQEDGRPVPSGAHAAAYDHLADEEALVAVRDVSRAALSVLRSSLAAAARLLRNDAAPRFLWRMWKYNAVTVLEKVKLRDDVIAVQAQVDDVVEALVSAAPNCEIEEVLLGAAEQQRGCPAFTELLSRRLVIVESSSGSAAAARLAISLGCDSYVRVKVPARMMHAELRAEPATGESGRQARATFAHLCAVAHVASAMPNETLQVLIMQDNVPPLAPSDLSAVVERTAVLLHDNQGARGARLTLLGGDTMENSMHAYALSLDGAQRIARSLSYILEETGVLLQSRFHALIQPLILGSRLLIDAAAGAPFPFAMESRNQLYDDQAIAVAGALKASAQLVLACISFDGHATHRRDLLADVRERYWLIPWLLRNATGLRVQLVRQDEASNAHTILILYEQHNRTEALARAGELCRTVQLVIALDRGQSGSLDVCCQSASEEPSRVAMTHLPSMPRWFQAALVQRSPQSWLEGIDFHPGLLHTQHHATWLRKAALAAHLWYDNEDAHRARMLLAVTGLATQQVVSPAAQLEHVKTTSTPLQEQLHAVRLVVTFTSIPPRIHFLPRVVASLLNQTRAPDVIYIILPRVWARGDASEWMPAVDRMARHIEHLDPRIVVQRPLVDLGPVMKLLPTLESEDSRVKNNTSGTKTRTLLLYLDDDWILPPGFVHAFVAASARKPGKVIFRSCGDGLYDAARRDAHTHWLGCSLPEAFAGVLLPLEALYVADFTDATIVKTIDGIVSRAVAHPACLRGDDFVLGELYVRLHIQSERLPSDLETNMGGTQLRLMDTVYALNGGSDNIVPSRYNSCAQHLTAVLDALLLPLLPLPKPALPPRLLPNLHSWAILFAEYRYAIVETAEQAVQALSVGTVPLMLHCRERIYDREFARMLSRSRVVCIGRSSAFLLNRLLHNSSAQQAFFEQRVVTQGGLKVIHSRLIDVSSMLQTMTRTTAHADDLNTTRDSELAAFAETAFMRGKTFSLWNFKPNEISPFPSAFDANMIFLPQVHSIVRPEDIHSCLDEFPGLRQIWGRISPWIVRSDLARLLYVYRHGGFYLDSDCEIVTKLPTTAEPVVLFVESIVPTSSLGPREDKSPERRLRIANYAFGSNVTRHAFFKECIEECLRRLNMLVYAAKTQQDVLWGCGPDVITSVYHAKNHSVNLLGLEYVKHRAVGSWRS